MFVIFGVLHSETYTFWTFACRLVRISAWEHTSTYSQLLVKYLSTCSL